MPARPESNSPIDPSTAFVSYAREDLEFALRLARDLKAKGAKVWMDKLDILPGQSWDDKVEIAVEHCGRMLVVLSPQSVASTKVKNEFMDALDQGKVVIPVFFRDCKVPQQLKRLQYADFRSVHAVGLEELLASLSSDQELTVEGDVPGAAPESPPAETYVEWRLRELQGRAEVGDTAAMVDLADAYLDGNGVSKDISQAIFWYRKAADAGNTAGMGKLALKYMFGEGVEQDDGQAAGWFAEQPTSATVLGCSTWPTCTSSDKAWNWITAKPGNGTRKPGVLVRKMLKQRLTGSK